MNDLSDILGYSQKQRYPRIYVENEQKRTETIDYLNHEKQLLASLMLSSPRPPSTPGFTIVITHLGFKNFVKICCEKKYRINQIFNFEMFSEIELVRIKMHECTIQLLKESKMRNFCKNQ